MVLRRVPFAILRQIAEQGSADRATTAAMVPGAGERDFESALENLLDEGSIEAPVGRGDDLVELAGGGWLRLTERGRQRMDEDDV